MTTSTAQHTGRAQAPGICTTVALDSAARHSLGQLKQNMGLPDTELTSCALTWYAYFDTQLRAGYNLTLWNAWGGKAYTLSLPETAKNSKLRGASEAPSAPAATHLCIRVSRLPGAGTRGHHHPRPAAPVFMPARPWLASASSRGSPSPAPALGVPRQHAVPVVS